MVRGTTPTIRLVLSAATAAQLGSYYITFSQNGTELFTVDNSACSMTTDGDVSVIEFTLTQAQTLQMEEGMDVDIQVRAMTGAGTAIASPSCHAPWMEYCTKGLSPDVPEV